MRLWKLPPEFFEFLPKPWRFSDWNSMKFKANSGKLHWTFPRTNLSPNPFNFHWNSNHPQPQSSSPKPSSNSPRTFPLCTSTLPLFIPFSFGVSQWNSTSSPSPPTTHHTSFLLPLADSSTSPHTRAREHEKISRKHNKNTHFFETNKTFPFSPFMNSFFSFFDVFRVVLSSSLTHTRTFSLSHSISMPYRDTKPSSSPTLTSRIELQSRKCPRIYSRLNDLARGFLSNCEVSRARKQQNVRCVFGKAEICVLKGLRLTSDYSQTFRRDVFVFHFRWASDNKRSERASAAVVWSSIKRLGRERMEF
jgi:hypothetical protein